MSRVPKKNNPSIILPTLHLIPLIQRITHIKRLLQHPPIRRALPQSFNNMLDLWTPATHMLLQTLNIRSRHPALRVPRLQRLRHKPNNSRTIGLRLPIPNRQDENVPLRTTEINRLPQQLGRVVGKILVVHKATVDDLAGIIGRVAQAHIFTDIRLDAVAANHDIRGCGRAVFEMQGVRNVSGAGVSVDGR